MPVEDWNRFKIFSRVPREKLAQLATMGSEMVFRDGDVLFRQGDPAGYLYAVLEGEVDLQVSPGSPDASPGSDTGEPAAAGGRSLVVETIGPGQDLGWSALVRPYLWSATARSRGGCRCLVLSAPDFRVMMDQDPEVGYAVSKGLNEVISQRLRHRTQKLIRLWALVNKQKSAST